MEQVTFKTLHKAQSIYSDIIKLDAEIIGIEKRSMKLSDKSQLVALDMIFESTDKKSIFTK